MTKRYSYSDWWCDNCHKGIYDDEDENYGEIFERI